MIEVTRKTDLTKVEQKEIWQWLELNRKEANSATEISELYFLWQTVFGHLLVMNTAQRLDKKVASAVVGDQVKLEENKD